MKYDLAKKLKDAGFPQKGLYEGTTYNLSNIKEVGVHIGDVYIPTLSELIEACGDKFRSLHKAPDEDGNYVYYCVSDTFTVPGDEQLGYSTPEEAVANLWLKLNSKE